MIKHIWSVLCRKSSIDSETNNISLNDVFEQLGVDVTSNNGKFPEVVNLPIEFEIVSMWCREVLEKHLKADIQIELVNPTGKKMKEFAEKVDMPVNMKRLRTRLRVVGFTVDMSGDYFFKVKVKEEGHAEYEQVAKLPLEVNLIKLKTDKNLPSS